MKTGKWVAGSIAVLLATIGIFSLSKVFASGSPWPVGDGDTAYPIGNTYGQYEDYGYGGDYHDGIDIMVGVSPPEVVNAIESGTVANVYGSPTEPLNYSMVVLSTADPTTGYYYVHFNPTMEYKELDSVTKDEPIGETVGYEDPWHAGPLSYDHLHVSRVQVDPSASSSDIFPYLFVENPLAKLRGTGSDTIAPAVDEILFFKDGSTEKLEKPEDFVGAKVDIVARVSDRFLSTPDRLLIPYRVRVEIKGKSSETPVYAHELKFEGQFGNSRSKFVSTAYKKDGSVPLKGDYDDREFWVVLTNLLPDDATGAWDTVEVDPGEYQVRVTAIDIAGNESVGMETTVTIP